MAGLMAAVTPMVVFLGASLSPNGPRWRAGICFFAAMLRLGRTATAGRGPWVALALSGAVLAISRPLVPCPGIDMDHNLMGLWGRGPTHAPTRAGDRAECEGTK